ncbi:hypothetical protein FOCC_FOCC007467 [Frankliniella occidentalis]|nr:hypothetical protein FOCC_FOCC007467 [Frankliniella occidentalis]
MAGKEFWVWGLDCVLIVLCFVELLWEVVWLQVEILLKAIWYKIEVHQFLKGSLVGLELLLRAVTYSGPRYICIRSGEHSSTANTHADGFRRTAEMDVYKNHFKTSDGRMKPVVMMTADAGPDECPRYKKNIAFAIDHPVV